MTHRHLSDVLDECLTLLSEDHASLEDVLARYPQHAAELRPVLEIVVEMRRMPRPAPRQAAVDAGKQRMLVAVRERNRERVTQNERNPAGFLARAEGWLAGLVAGLQRPAASTPGFGWQAAVATAAALLIVAVAGGLLLPPWLGTRVERTAQLESLRGGVLVRAGEGADWVSASSDARLRAADQVRTDTEGLALLTFFDGSTTALESGTQLTIVELSSRRDRTAKAIVLHQERGQTHHEVEPLRTGEARFHVRTPAGVAAVRGTRFDVVVDEDGRTTVVQISGLVTFTFDDTEVAFEPGWARTISPDGWLSEPVLVPPPEGTDRFVRWPTGEPSATATATPTETPLPTATRTPQPTDTLRPSATPLNASDEGPSQPTATATAVPPTATATATYELPTKTPQPQVTATAEGPSGPEPTETPVPSPTATADGPDGPEPTETPVPSPTATPDGPGNPEG